MTDSNEGFSSTQFLQAMDTGVEETPSSSRKRMGFILGLGGLVLLWVVTWDGKESESTAETPTLNPVAQKRAAAASVAGKPAPKKKNAPWPNYPAEEISQWNPFSTGKTMMSGVPPQNPSNGFGDAVATVDSPEELPEEGVVVPSTRVTAILTSGKKQSALIDGKIVAVGELVDGHEVLEIRKDRVLLSPKQTLGGILTPSF